MKTLAFSLPLLVLLAAAPEAGAQTCEPARPCGDVNDSGAVNTTDALNVLKKAVGQDVALQCACTQGEGTCESDLAACSAELSTCTGELLTANGVLESCLTDLSTTNADLAECQSAPVCGDGNVDDGEDCDAADLDGATCTSEGFAGGMLRCGSGCTFDTAGCWQARFIASRGVIVDRLTCLEWEIKDSDDGSSDKGNPHDVDNVYNYSETGTVRDGSAFIELVAALNGDLGDPCYASRCDWRIPTIEEWMSVARPPVDCDTPPCLVSKLFLPSQEAGYWSSTTNADTPTNARYMNLNNGQVYDGLKTGYIAARAVRGENCAPPPPEM